MSWVTRFLSPTPATEEHHPSPPVALSANERRALAELDKILAQPTVPDSLLPRAAELIPQLIGLLRETELPVQAVAERVGKDALLAAEVMRLASSTYYGVQVQISNLLQAIQLIGIRGLQQVIARVVLKPIYRGVGSVRNSVIAERLETHAETLAHHTAALAEMEGQPEFDGYLVGMLYNTGWRVALRGMDLAGVDLHGQLSAEFIAALAERVHRLFGLAAQRWDITPGFTAFAQDARLHGLSAGRHPLLPLLQRAQLLCLRHDAAPNRGPR